MLKVFRNINFTLLKSTYARALISESNSNHNIDKKEKPIDKRKVSILEYSIGLQNLINYNSKMKNKSILFDVEERKEMNRLAKVAYEHAIKN